MERLEAHQTAIGTYLPDPFPDSLTSRTRRILARMVSVPQRPAGSTEVGGAAGSARTLGTTLVLVLIKAVCSFSLLFEVDPLRSV